MPGYQRPAGAHTKAETRFLGSYTPGSAQYGETRDTERPTHAFGCWVDGGKLHPSRCPRCVTWNPEARIEHMLGRMDRLGKWSGGPVGKR